jgi:hypothetical protein
MEHPMKVDRSIDILRSFMGKRPSLSRRGGDETEEDDDEQSGEGTARET